VGIVGVGPLLTSALVGGRRSASFSGSFVPGRNPAVQFIGGFIGLSAGLEDLKKRKSTFPTGVQSPDRPARSLVTVPTRLPSSPTSQTTACVFITKKSRLI
jgi:hypothetical protein